MWVYSAILVRRVADRGRSIITFSYPSRASKSVGFDFFGAVRRTLPHLLAGRCAAPSRQPDEEAPLTPTAMIPWTPRCLFLSTTVLIHECRIRPQG